MTFGLGGIRDKPDDRDHPYVPPRNILKHLPGSADLTANLPPVYNQEQINSCTSNAIAAAIEFDEMKKGARHTKTPARLFIYYNERVIEGDPDKDAGAQIRDGIKTVAAQGVCEETLWPYRKSNVLKKPPQEAYSKAHKYRAVEYERIERNLDHLRTCLASGFPFVFGIEVFTSFQGSYVKRTGTLNMPTKHEKGIGLHAVLAAGYDDEAERFLVRNSWGPGWGQKGYFTMPYQYLLDSKISHDFWTIRFVT